jgi:SAM-dependent methyltransferase
MLPPQRARSAPRRRSLFAGLRRLLHLARTADFDEIAELMGRFDARQRQLDRTAAVGILDIKNLGYELGRQLAATHLADQPTAAVQTQLKSKLCTQDDFATDWLRYWCRELRIAPFYHRKIWELCYVAQALFAAGQLQPGRRGIAFGCGEEPLPSLFAKYGPSILATDLPADRPEAEVWRLTTQHAQAVETIRRSDICPDPQRLADITFQPVDMNDLPRELDGGFDFCWSTCALEHLGTLERGLRFIENSLRTLKPGGIAVHTTEFTIDGGETIDNHPVVLYQRRHLEQLAERLVSRGCELAEFDFDPGSGVLDRFVDLPPYQHEALISPQHHAHLKLLFDGYTCTSVGMIIRV